MTKTNKSVVTSATRQTRASSKQLSVKTSHKSTIKTKKQAAQKSKPIKKSAVKKVSKTVQKSGQFGSSYGAMGIKVPFITITRPKQIQVPNYNELYGYPAHKMVTVGACTGFLRCREVHVISPTASDEEKTLIENLMKSGVYVTE